MTILIAFHLSYMRNLRVYHLFYDLKLLIHSKSGTILEDISQFGKEEAEVLLRADSKFKVISLYQSAGSWHAELEKLLQLLYLYTGNNMFIFFILNFLNIKN